MRVATSDPEVRRLVELIAATVESGGGYVHPELVVNHSGGNLWLSLPRTANPYADEELDRPHPEAPPALIVPNALHVPVTKLDWAPSDEVLEYRADASHLSTEQRTILDAMVALFNAVDKVRVVGRAYAQHSLSDDPELLTLIRQARPGYLAEGAVAEMTIAAALSDGAQPPAVEHHSPTSNPGADNSTSSAADPATADTHLPNPATADTQLPDPTTAESTQPDPTPTAEAPAAAEQAAPGNWWNGQESPAHTVVTSRLRSEMGEGDEGPIGFFMPMIDMLNHHPYGSRYERTDAGDWLIRAHHPKPDSDQIYVRYNKADALGVALGLGYFEADARFVSSVSCEFDLAPLGTVHVFGVSQQRRRLPTPRLVRTADGLRVGGIVLQPGREQVLRTLLAMPLRSILATTAPGASVGGDGAPAEGAAGDSTPAGRAAGSSAPAKEPATAEAPADGTAGASATTTPSADALASAMVAGIVAANVDYYERLAEFCADADAEAHPQRPMFAQVAARQLELLAQYQR